MTQLKRYNLPSRAGPFAIDVALPGIVKEVREENGQLVCYIESDRKVFTHDYQIERAKASGDLVTVERTPLDDEGNPTGEIIEEHSTWAPETTRLQCELTEPGAPAPMGLEPIDTVTWAGGNHTHTLFAAPWLEWVKAVEAEAKAARQAARVVTVAEQPPMPMPPPAEPEPQPEPEQPTTPDGEEE